MAGTAVTSTLRAGSLGWAIGNTDLANLDVPAEVRLTVDPGAVVKGAANFVSVEGTLDAVGTGASPVIFTSVNDHSVGGLTGTGAPSPGSWQGLDINGNADIENAVIRYADTAIDASNSGAVGFRGTFSDNAMDIESCDWGSNGCGVDAAYSNWGDGSTGPFPASGPLVCGTVTVSPWLPDSGDSGNMFSGGDCGGSTTPDATLNNAETSYSIDIGNEQIQCDNGFQDACQAIQAAQSCLSAAYGLAGGSITIHTARSGRECCGRGKLVA